ncbi:DNA-binding transcription factor yap1 [Ophidiomyces ophidiicola]|nr:DNA-binding transcription factor yap1 [Ophidiomyces ophidiicola]KAI1928222.1 DNA-binding transcription factor yap1 [Ophidiomyces ophidiicola]KAI1973159.1 DNA-binding transcription factor yap1 [Ophidiomyces ophidiicola]KAI2027332.1 DNA-binding transcription factor yap1 [Ophidiomyces ophidiicola]KAI2031654.1 DNA-binding transcription factor yap1 [Ophidiomyces ophidiicola]
MSNYDSLYQRSLYFSPDQQDLLLATLGTSHQTMQPQSETTFDGIPVKTQSSPIQQLQNGSASHDVLNSPSEHEASVSGRLSFGDDSPFLDFTLDPEFEIADEDALIGDLPGTEGREKRKSMDGKGEEESGKKRKENDEKVAKKPGRKPLTSEPTSKRKAQNRAAQRAFRERKEKHLKDLETKVEDLEKASQAANNENTLLRAQIERLQVELREYRKRLSWVSSGNRYPMPTNAHLKNNENRPSRPTGDFSFEFPKFGDLPGSHIFNTSLSKSQLSPNSSHTSPLTAIQNKAPGVLNRDMLKSTPDSLPRTQQFNSPGGPASALSPKNDSIRAIYGSGAGRSVQNPIDLSYGGTNTAVRSSQAILDQNKRQGSYSSLSRGRHGASNTNSPSTSSESQHGRASSIGTSPEPPAHSPPTANIDAQSKPKTVGNTPLSLDECQKSFYEKLGQACGCAEDPVPAALSHMKDESSTSISPLNTSNNNDNSLGIDWLVQQNNGQFDPVLFNDYREPQDAVLSQDFGSFFNDAFPLQDVGSSFPNFDLGANHTPKADLISQIDRTLDADEEVVPGEDRSQMLSCTKIWSVLIPDRLQSMEKFRNGEIDVDSLCTELRTKARCSEGGVVVNKKDVDDIMTRAL